MAEVIGAIASGMTLAGLFRVCLDAIDLIQTARNQDLDVKKLVLKLNIEKYRLYAWGEAVGLTSIPAAGHTRPLDAYYDGVQKLIRDILQMTIYLFVDAQKLKHRYGCKKLPPTQAGKPFLVCDGNFGHVDTFATSFSHFKVTDGSSHKLAMLALKTRWIIHDRKKFMELVAEVKAFVDGLHSFTQPLYTAARQESKIKHGINQIDDVETLNIIAEVCETDHPAIANAASERSSVISLASSRLLDIERWASDVAPGSQDEPPDLESLTVTELKHRVLVSERALAAANSELTSMKLEWPIQPLRVDLLRYEVFRNSNLSRYEPSSHNLLGDELSRDIFLRDELSWNILSRNNTTNVFVARRKPGILEKLRPLINVCIGALTWLAHLYTLFPTLPATTVFPHSVYPIIPQHTSIANASMSTTLVYEQLYGVNLGKPTNHRSIHPSPFFDSFRFLVFAGMILTSF